MLLIRIAQMKDYIVPVTWEDSLQEEIWNTWENEENLDMIETWNLYQNGVLISKEGTQSIQTEGTQEVFFEQRYPHMESMEGLSLVPVYSQSGEHADEAIRIEQIVMELPSASR